MRVIKLRNGQCCVENVRLPFDKIILAKGDTVKVILYMSDCHTMPFINNKTQ